MNRADRNVEFQPSHLHHKGNLSPVRPRQKMPTIYRHRMQVQSEPLKQDSLRWPRDNSYLRKRLDKQVQQERSEMLMMSGRTSENNPQWMTVNFDHYRKNGYMRPKRLSLIDERHYDVLNNPKTMFNGRNEDKYFLDHINAMDTVKNQAVFKTNYGSSFYSPINRSLMLQSDITGKVGSIDRRDYTIRRPQLKVGSNSFVDTYSPF